MNEYGLQLVASLKLITVVVYATLYGYGGINNKALRRVFGALVLTSAFIGFSCVTNNFSWWYLLCAPLYFASTSIGYGADKTWLKVIKRSYCGLAYVAASLPLCIINETWILLALHTVFCLGMSITLGVVNPVDARNEETLIGASISLLPLYMI